MTRYRITKADCSKAVGQEFELDEWATFDDTESAAWTAAAELLDLEFEEIADDEE